jgi:N-acyl-D-amino-acid deacylase
MTVLLQFCAATLFLALVPGLSIAAQPQTYDVIIRGGTVYDGSGAAPTVGDVAIQGDRIAAVGALGSSTADLEIDAAGLFVAPGFVNMLSQASGSLLRDGRSLGDIHQGVTLEVLGEGSSMGPVNEEGERGEGAPQNRWNTLGEALEYMVERGVSPNVASNVGATTVRTLVIGREDRPPTEQELDRMRTLVREAMEEGAVGLSSALIYAPGHYAGTEELVELARIAGEYGGMYISHMRSEGSSLLEAVDELITIARRGEVRAEIFHLKAMGRGNWAKMDDVRRRVSAARASGLSITADMYTYLAGGTSLAACIPPWAHEGGRAALERRLADPATRRRITAEMGRPSDSWENLHQMSSKVILTGSGEEGGQPLAGQTLGEIAARRGLSQPDAIIDLVLEHSPGAIYFMMSEENLRKQIAYPWVSFGSDGGSMDPETARGLTHPRAYGNFARLLGTYVRDEQLIPMEEAIRRLTSLPAENIKAVSRGRLKAGFFADVVVFDPEEVQDHGTYESPHQLSTGMVHVFVNGVQVLDDGAHTGATPGRIVRGPGWRER